MGCPVLFLLFGSRLWINGTPFEWRARLSVPILYLFFSNLMNFSTLFYHRDRSAPKKRPMIGTISIARALKIAL